jgi:predicted nucleic acid-binding protein
MRVRTLADYFADSYAFVAHLEGNERYNRIFRTKILVTTALNVLEIYSTLLRRIDSREAKQLASAFLRCVVPVPEESVLVAGEFRRAMRSRRRDCSYIDSWGYAAAKHLKIPFLTGDPAFRGIENVSFVR